MGADSLQAICQVHGEVEPCFSCNRFNHEVVCIFHQRVRPCPDCKPIRVGVGVPTGAEGERLDQAEEETGDWYREHGLPAPRGVAPPGENSLRLTTFAEGGVPWSEDAYEELATALVARHAAGSWVTKGWRFENARKERALAGRVATGYGAGTGPDPLLRVCDPRCTHDRTSHDIMNCQACKDYTDKHWGDVISIGGVDKKRVL